MADIAVTAANVIPDAGYQYRDEVAGATITAGQAVYLDATDLVAGQGGNAASAKACDANASAAAAAAVGIALNGASRGQPVRILTGGTFAAGGTTAVGETYVVSATDTLGKIAPIADAVTGWFVTYLFSGIAGNKGTMRLSSTGVAKP